MRRAPFATIANVSLWETIRRSLATTLHHAAADRLAADLRRRDAEGLRLRADGRDPLRRLLVDLHRRAAADDLEGARAGVRAADRPGAAEPRRRERRLRSRPSEEALAAEPAPDLSPVGGGRAAGRSDAPGEARAPAAAATREASWPRPLTLREIAEKLVLAGVGAVALTAERADALAEELSARGGIGPRRGARADRGAGRPLAQRGVRLGEWTGVGAGGRSSASSGSSRAPSSRSSSSASRSSSTGCGCSSREPARGWLGSVEGGVVGRPHDRAASGGDRWRRPRATGSSGCRSRAAASSRPTTSRRSTIR